MRGRRAFGAVSNSAVALSLNRNDGRAAVSGEQQVVARHIRQHTGVIAVRSAKASSKLAGLKLQPDGGLAIEAFPVVRWDRGELVE